MVFLLFIIGVGLVGVSGRLVARALVIPRLQLKAHLREIQDYGFEQPMSDSDLPLNERLRRGVIATGGRLGRFLGRTVPSLPMLQKSELSAAGFYDVDAETVHGMRAMLAIALPTVLLLLLLMSGGAIGGMDWLMLLTSAGAGWQLPSFIIRKRGTKRLDEVERQLPELIDLLIATVEAGMGFSAALNLVSEKLTGALGDELRLTMKQQSLGMSMQQAMDEMVSRCDTQSVRAFVRTAGRGESLGVSIGPVLRELSADERRRRRQAAREKMQKAPVKMIFPLMFLIFPALMIVLMYPAAYSVTKNLSGI
jgi:tight adherence protein C